MMSFLRAYARLFCVRKEDKGNIWKSARKRTFNFYAR